MYNSFLLDLLPNVDIPYSINSIHSFNPPQSLCTKIAFNAWCIVYTFMYGCVGVGVPAVCVVMYRYVGYIAAWL